ncbi:hypothetical protein PRIPAC_88023, partial [Pristionchus pacificus]|uniref:Uncharacterized protein n=1 Tax=Pristionchus pacificus TaxID=54126 RepID=A0A2A6B6I3_PRIPA
MRCIPVLSCFLLLWIDYVSTKKHAQPAKEHDCGHGSNHRVKDLINNLKAKGMTAAKGILVFGPVHKGDHHPRPPTLTPSSASAVTATTIATLNDDKKNISETPPCRSPFMRAFTVNHSLPVCPLFSVSSSHFSSHFSS